MKMTPQDILSARAKNKEARDRDFANSLGISEAEYIAAYCSTGDAVRLRVDVDQLLADGPSLGRIMTLTRNDSAVHEKTGQFEKVFPGSDVAMTLGAIDLRIFKKQWAFCFARTVEIMGKSYHTIQFFDHQGMAIFKMYEKDGCNLETWQALVTKLTHEDQSGVIVTKPALADEPVYSDTPDIEAFRQRWSAMTDVHQLHGILKDMKISRHDAVKFVDQVFAHELSKDAVAAMLEGAHKSEMPIMCFVGNHGCVQIFTGKVGPVKMVGPWLNLLDEEFHMHLQFENVDKVWRVRKPTKDGFITSMEIFDKDGNLIIQFFGERMEGKKEREDWRNLMDHLPELSCSAVA